MHTSKRLGRGIYLTVAVYGAIIYAVLLIFPAITGQLIDKYGIDAEALGLLASLEMGALSLATLPAYLWLKKVNPRQVVLALTVVMVVGNVYSAYAPTFTHLCLSRVVTGAAGGSVAVLMFALARRAPDSGKCLGAFVTSQLIMAAVLLGIYPHVFEDLGLQAVYLVLAAMSALAMLTATFVTRHRLTPIATRASAVAGRAPTRRVVAGLVAITLFYTCLSGVWAFVGLLAEESGVGTTSSNTILAVATAAGILSAALATTIGDTPRRAQYTVLGLVLMGASLVAFTASPEAWRYGVAAILFKFAWTFALPFMLAGLAALPGGDGVMNTTNLMLGVGSTAGPYAAGFIISNMGGLDTMLAAAMVGLGVTVVCARILEMPLSPSHVLPAKEAA